jgi:VanZ family protein
MQLFFRILSLIYVAAVFLLADSSTARSLASFNRYSLLHIPLYGIMSVLIFFSIAPVKPGQISQGDVSIRLPRLDLKRYCFIAGVIALGVAVADEYCQSFISTRAASSGDVLLDLVGIILSMLLTMQFFRNYTSARRFSKR